jgi:hypothetical protein
MSTNFAYLPPLPPIAVILTAPPAVRFPSPRRESLAVAMTVLLAGLTVFAWTVRLDTTDSHIFVTAAAVLTAVLPEATFALLRDASRRLTSPLAHGLPREMRPARGHR